MVPRPADANILTCKLVFTIKCHLEDITARHKARLVASGFTQAYDIDYTETISLVVHLNSICVLLSLALNQAWSLHQLDDSNAFLFGNLEEQVLWTNPLGMLLMESRPRGVSCDELFRESSRVHGLCLLITCNLYMNLHNY